MKLYNNDGDFPLSVAVWLANNEYDFTPKPTELSVTDLLKSTRQLVLRQRRLEQEVLNPVAIKPINLSSLVAAKFGNAIHNGIETSWVNNVQESLKDLGYPQGLINNVMVNPTEEELLAYPNAVPVYMEIRNTKQIDGYTISGKFDFIADGVLEDFKSTSTYSWVKGVNDAKYVMQGSLYRWLNPDIVTQDYMMITFIFTDWSKAQSFGSTDYPSQRIMSKTFTMKSMPETEQWVRHKLLEVKAGMGKPEAELPLCNKEELWQDAPKFKYYKNPAKVGGRSTKNFDSELEANERLGKDGYVGVVIVQPAKAKACAYCNEYEACTQKDQLIIDGLLDEKVT